MKCENHMKYTVYFLTNVFSSSVILTICCIKHPFNKLYFFMSIFIKKKKNHLYPSHVMLEMISHGFIITLDRLSVVYKCSVRSCAVTVVDKI